MSTSEATAVMPPIVCLCGSTRFVDEFNRHRKALTEAGEIVLSIEVVTTQAREDDPQHADPELKARLDELHRRKIDLADYCLIVSDESGYFGDSTRGEIEYADAHGKPVRFDQPAAMVRAREMGLVNDTRPSLKAPQPAGVYCCVQIKGYQEYTGYLGEGTFFGQRYGFLRDGEGREIARFPPDSVHLILPAMDLGETAGRPALPAADEDEEPF